MAVLIVMDWAGNTKANYDEIVARMGVQGAPAEGIYLHVAAPTPAGMRIVEVWEDLEGFEIFVREQLLPTAKAAGVTTQPEYTATAVVNFFTPTLDRLQKLAGSFAA